MPQGGGPRWIVGITIALLSVLAAPVVVWTCLPVHRTAGPIVLSASPAGIFSQEFDLRIENKGVEGKYLLPKHKLHEKTEPMLYGCSFGLEYETIPPGGVKRMKVSPGTALHFAKPTPGLKRITMVHDGFGGIETDIWVLHINGKTFAIK